jgi:hypothetical protein
MPRSCATHAQNSAMPAQMNAKSMMSAIASAVLKSAGRVQRNVEKWQDNTPERRINMPVNLFLK